MKLTGWILAAVLMLTTMHTFAGEENAAIREAREELDAAARKLAELYKESFEVGEKKAMLGILLHDSGNDRGIELAGVTPGTGAVDAGLRAGDLLIQIGDESLVDRDVKPLKVISGYMKNVAPGESVPIVYSRGGETSSVQVQTHERRMHMSKILDGDQLKMTDISTGMIAVEPDFVDLEPSLARYFGVEEGVLVIKSTEPLMAGDVLLEVDGKPIDSALKAYEVLGYHDHMVEARVRRNGKVMNVSVDGNLFSAFDLDHMNHDIDRIRKHVTDDGDVRVEIIVDDTP
jgi:membrane-associated protease RseP (regulator of RpoE activity)